jgi:hypothetical protein
MYKHLASEVAGEIVADTILDNSVHPPIVTFLHFHFTGWLGDDILETFPCFLISERLKNSIEEQKLKGISFDSVKITKSSDFVMTSINDHLPIFYWAKINGVLGVDDFVIAKDFRLLVSDKAYYVISAFNSTNALFEEYRI